MRASLAYALEHGTIEGFMPRLSNLTDGDEEFRADPFIGVQKLLGIDEYADILERYGAVAD